MGDGNECIFLSIYRWSPRSSTNYCIRIQNDLPVYMITEALQLSLSDHYHWNSIKNLFNLTVGNFAAPSLQWGERIAVQIWGRYEMSGIYFLRHRKGFPLDRPKWDLLTPVNGETLMSEAICTIYEWHVAVISTTQSHGCFIYSSSIGLIA